MLNKYKHFYFNKYLVSRFSSNKYPISYDFRHKALWFRTTKVASRTIHFHLERGSSVDDYIYSSPVGYEPSRYRDFFKFAFVRNPIDRFMSAFRDKVLGFNYFKFSEAEYGKMKNFSSFIDWVERNQMQKKDAHLQEQFTMIDLDNIDFIGRFERFSEDFSYVADRLNLEFDQDLQLNQSRAKGLISVSKDDIRRIARIYRRDIRIFYPHEIDKIATGRTARSKDRQSSQYVG